MNTFAPRGLSDFSQYSARRISKSSGRSSSRLRRLSAPTTQISVQRSLPRRAWKTHASHTVRITRWVSLSGVWRANSVHSLRTTPSSGAVSSSGR
ncbi:hypothetical protein [Streptomyces sp. NPDC017260]|uniref:hypothetical protein n=1 Tax=unclassified Streptomyces TaxID=2593676 RepID=UPI0037A4E2C7